MKQLGKSKINMNLDGLCELVGILDLSLDNLYELTRIIEES